MFASGPSRVIEIGHDDNGRPTSALGSISICHAGEIAMAVCLASPGLSSGLAASAMPWPPRACAAEIPSRPPAATATPRATRGVIFALGLSAIVNVLLAVALFQTYRY